MCNGELEPITQSLKDEGIWQVFGYVPPTLFDRPITVLPDGRYVLMQGQVYWLAEFAWY